MTLAKLNQHGVATRGVTTVRVPMPKTLRCGAVLRLAELKDGWRFGYDFKHNEGGGGAAPSNSKPAFASRDEALGAGLAWAVTYFDRQANWYGRHHAGAAKSCRRALALIRQFIQKRFPNQEAKMSAALAAPEKSNGHAVTTARRTDVAAATKTRPHTKSHEAREPSARKRKEGPRLHRHGSDGSPSADGPVARNINAIPPGATSTTTPAGIRRFDPDAITDPAAITGQEIECDLGLLHPHPDNRRSSDNDGDVEQLAESIRIDNLIQAITVRIAPPHWDLPEGHYQIVCGERRWRACRVAGRGSVRCKVRADLDDAAALRIIAAENALRRDLNPIEKAQLVERLCTANEDGSKALTRDQAAQVIGLESGGAASNMARLLSLPDVWQKRVASGELAWSWAQEIYPYLNAEPVMDQLEQAWRHGDAVFESRQELARSMGAFTLNFCRRLDAAEFDAPEGAEQGMVDELECVELPDPDAMGGKKKTTWFATNVKRFDELQAQARTKQSKAKASKVGADERPAKDLFGPPTAAEIKAAAKGKIENAEVRSAKLAAAVADWRQKLLRHAISESIDQGQDDGLRVVLALACGSFGGGGPGMGVFLARHAAPLNAISQWDKVAAFRDDKYGREELASLAQRILAHDEPRLFEHDFIDRLALDLGLDVEDEWLALQQPKSKGSRELIGQDLLEEFFLLFRVEELHALAKTIEIHVPGATKEKLIQVLLGIPRGSTRRLKLPKAIAHLQIPGSKKAKAESGKRKAARRGK